MSIDSEKTDYPKRVDPRYPPVIDAYSYRTIFSWLIGYILVLVLAACANRTLYRLDGLPPHQVDSISNNSLFASHGSDVLWEFIGTSGASHVDSYVRKVEGSKLFAFKGAVVIDEHISDVLKTFGSVKITPEWADMLQIMETLPISQNTSDNMNADSIMQQKKDLFGSVFDKIKAIRPKKHTTTGANAQKERKDGDNILLHRPYTPLTMKSNVFGATTTIPATNLTDIVYQYYTLPWPIAPREFLFHREFRLYPATATVTADYTSIHDDRQPLPSSARPARTPFGASISKHTIRAESPFAHWVFQDLDTHCLQRRNSNKQSLLNTQEGHICEEVALQRAEEAYRASTNYEQVVATNDVAVRKGRTFVSIETLVDNKGSLPPWLVNYVQRSWPSKTLSAFAASVQKQAAADRISVDGNEANGGNSVVQYVATW